jgi:hypothetical protein
MAINTYPVSPFDPNNILNGPYRLANGITRWRTVTLDTAYGEFATHLYVGTAGDVSVTTWDGTVIIFNNLAAGVVHNIGSVQINSSGTTAANIRWGS